MRVMIAAFLFLITVSATGDTEHPSCLDIDHPFQHLSADKLLDIAAHCTDPAMTKLMKHRAHNAQLVQDHAVLDQLERTGRSITDWNMEINQIFLSLVEVYTGVMELSPEQRLSVLDMSYARANEIGELRLGGYDPQAARLDVWDPTTLLMKAEP